MLARACGKTNVHNLEPEDLAALTTEAAAMARVPLAGTNYIPGVSEERALDEIKTMLDRYLENPIDRLPERERRCEPSSEPEKIVAIDAEELSGQRFAYQEDMQPGRGHRPGGRDARAGHQLARGRRRCSRRRARRRSSTATPTPS